MAIGLEERFVVAAPAGPVWDYLVDPRRVVACVPGGELEELLDARTFHGTVRVRVGALTFAYRGRIHLAEVDPAARRVRIVGEARERSGSGAARLTLESTLTERAGPTTDVLASIRLDVAGRLVELGRGFIEELGHRVFQQFAGCVAATIEAEEAARAGTPAAVPGAPARQDALRALPLLLGALRAWVSGLLRPRVTAPPGAAGSPRRRRGRR